MFNNMSDKKKDSEKRKQLLKLLKQKNPAIYDTVEFTKLVGKFIKERRKEFKISPFDLAKSLNITYQTYNKYENGQINIPLHTLFLITEKLNISMDSLINKYHKEIYGANYRSILNINSNIFPKFSDVDLEKSIDIVKKIYESGDKQIITALNNNLDIYYSLIRKDDK